MFNDSIPHVVDTLPVHLTLKLNPPHNTIKENIIFLDEGYTFPIMGNITLENFIEYVKHRYSKELIYSVQADSKTVGVLIIAMNELNQLNVYVYIHADYRHFGITDIIIQSLIIAARSHKVDLFFEIEDKNKSAKDSFLRMIKNVETFFIDADKNHVWCVKPSADILCSSSNRWLSEELSWGLKNIL